MPHYPEGRRTRSRGDMGELFVCEERELVVGVGQRYELKEAFGLIDER